MLNKTQLQSNTIIHHKIIRELWNQLSLTQQCYHHSLYLLNDLTSIHNIQFISLLHNYHINSLLYCILYLVHKIHEVQLRSSVCFRYSDDVQQIEEQLLRTFQWKLIRPLLYNQVLQCSQNWQIFTSPITFLSINFYSMRNKLVESDENLNKLICFTNIIIERKQLYENINKGFIGFIALGVLYLVIRRVLKEQYQIHEGGKKFMPTVSLQFIFADFMNSYTKYQFHELKKWVSLVEQWHSSAAHIKCLRNVTNQQKQNKKKSLKIIKHSKLNQISRKLSRKSHLSSLTKSPKIATLQLKPQKKQLFSNSILINNRSALKLR